jgi:hypothetical protein
VTGLPTPDRLRPQVFSTSRRLDPPRACWPCFMPDPLMGFALQSFAPPVQPYAVSDANALMMLKRLHALPKPINPSRMPKRRARASRPHVGEPSERPSPARLCSTRESATPGWLFRPSQARSSLGLSPLQGIPPHRNGHGSHRASPHEVTRPHDESNERTLHRVLLPGEVGWSLSRLPTLLGFATF